MSDSKALPKFVLVLALFLLLFIFKPVHLDDPVFLKTGEHLLRHPFQPFLAKINWIGTKRSLFFEGNPFFLSYFFAAVIGLLGSSEWILHAAYSVFPFLCLMFVYGIARQRRTDPVVAATLFLSCPAFLLSSTTLMSDVPLLAFYLMAIYYYLRFTSTNSPADGLLFALGAVLAGFTKYIGLTLIPLLFVDLAWRGKLRKGMPFLLLPVGYLMLWGIYSYSLAGTSHVAFSAQYLDLQWRAIVQKIAACLSFTGLALLGFTILALLDRTSGAVWALVATICGFAAFQLNPIHYVPGAILMGIGISSAILVVPRVFRRDPDLLVCLWLAGMLVYTWISEFIAARVVLLFAVPLFLLLSSQIPREKALLCAGLNIVLSLMLAQADFRWAESYKHFAETMSLQRTHYFAHWGLQYYLEKRGLEPFDYERDSLQAGDLLVVPQIGGTSAYPLPTGNGRFLNAKIRLEKSVALDVHQGLFIMNENLDAGFYCHTWGMVPFSWGARPLDTMDLFRVTQVFLDDGNRE